MPTSVQQPSNSLPPSAMLQNLPPLRVAVLCACQRADVLVHFLRHGVQGVKHRTLSPHMRLGFLCDHKWMMLQSTSMWYPNLSKAAGYIFGSLVKWRSG